MIKKIPFSRLSKALTSQIEDLVSRCIDYEQLSLSQPDLSDPDGTAYLYYEQPKDKAPSSVLLSFPLGDYACDVSAFTEPDKRCRGYFSALLEKLSQDIGEIPLCFYVDGYSYDALKTLEVIDAEYAGTEHIMQYTGQEAESPEKAEAGPGRDASPEGAKVSLRRACESDIPALSAIHSEAFECEKKDSADFLENAVKSNAAVYVICTDREKPAGMFIISPDEEGSSLYCFCVDTELQGRGIAAEALRQLLEGRLAAYPVILHVSEENEAAFRLYRSAGFTSTQELMEYWF